METVTQFVDTVADNAAVFFMPNESVAAQCRATVKATFDATRQDDLKKGLLPLPQLYVEGFDTDQIWAELELQHRPLLQFVDKAVRKMLRKPHKVVLPVLDEDSSEEEEEEEEGGEEGGADEAEDGEDGGSEVSGPGASEKVEEGDDEGDDADLAGSGGGAAAAEGADQFFSLQDMEMFAEHAGNEALGDGIDLLREDLVPDGDDNDPYSGPTYADIFGGGKGDGDSDVDSQGFPAQLEAQLGGEEQDGDDNADDDDDDDDDADLDMLTPYQREQRKVKAQIAELEAEAVKAKPWALTGEIQSQQRPENSLLETVMEYEQAQPAAPEITAEATMELEEVIKQRIRDELWDDVERKVAEEVKRAVELPEVSTDVSKLGLGEIYEKEYMKQAMGVEETDEKEVLRNEIRGLFTNLCHQLDALSNFAFTPKPAMPEMDVKPNVAAIAMEEVIPTAVSDARLQAPEEVYRKKRGREAIVVGNDEMTRDEKKRRRRARKAAKSKRHREAAKARKLVAKLNPGLGNKYEKEKMLKELGAAKNVTTTTASSGGAGASFKSAKFFTALQAQVQAEVAGISAARTGSKKKKAKGAASLKL